MPTYHLKVESEDKGKRLDVYLAKHLPDIPSRTFVKKLIDGGFVSVNDHDVKAHHKISDTEEIKVSFPDRYLEPSDIIPQNIPLDILFEDNYLIVINKPSGMLVHPAQNVYKDTLVNALMHHSQQLSNCNDDPYRPGIVHRLDQETSGVMIVAKDNNTHADLAHQFQAHTIEKQYIALVQGLINFDEGVIDAPIGRHPTHRDKKSVQYDDSAKESITYYKVDKRFANTTRVLLFPKTGRTHQLRVHLSHIGHSILGDVKYGKKNTFSRLALHSQQITFRHPHTKKMMSFRVETPKEFLNVT